MMHHIPMAAKPPQGAFLSILIQLAIVVGLAILQKLLSPKAKAGVPDTYTPTAQEGIPVPVFFGRAEIAPNTCWTGYFARNKKKQSWLYYAIMQNVFCWGVVNEIIDISFGEKSLRNWIYHYGGPVDLIGLLLPMLNGADASIVNAGAPTVFNVYGNQLADDDTSPALFGGNQQQGGVEGQVTMYWGTDGQPVNTTLATDPAYGADSVSAWPRMCYMVMGHVSSAFYFGANSATPQPMLAVMRRTFWWESAASPLGQNATQCNIRGDANPAEIIYDLWTHPGYGLGRSPVRMDVASFAAVAETLRNEVIDEYGRTGFGLSVVASSQEQASDVIGSICDHIDAAFGTDPITGLIYLKLIRNDYDIDTIPTVNPANSWDLKYTPSAWSDTVNELKITYRRFVDSVDRIGYVDAVVNAQDLANFQKVGRVTPKTINMPYVTDPAIAALIAERTRRALGIPLAKFEWTTNRTAYAIRKGDVVLLDASAFGLSGVVVRVLDIDYGSLEHGDIHVTGIQDVYAVNKAVYTPPAGGEWQTPVGDVGGTTTTDPFPEIWGTGYEE